MTVTVYRSSDPSAPGAFNNTANSLIAILDACLVNGYGTGGNTKAPAGWTKAFSAANKAAYRNSTIAPSTGFYLRIDDSSTTEARAVGYESMIDVDNGADAFPTNTQVVGGLYLPKSATTTTWMLIADQRCFYFFYKFAANAKWYGFFFGDIVSRLASDPYCCAIIGRGNTGVNTNDENLPRATTSLNSTSPGHFIARNYNGTVKSVNFNKYAPLTSGFLGTGGFPYPNPCDSNFLMDRCLVIDDTSGASAFNLRGHMPGMWNPMHSDPATDSDTFSGNGDLAGRSYLIVANVNTSGVGKTVMETTDTWR